MELSGWSRVLACKSRPPRVDFGLTSNLADTRRREILINDFDASLLDISYGTMVLTCRFYKQKYPEVGRRAPVRVGSSSVAFI